MIAQRSPEWYAARAGKVTASRVADVVAKTRAGWSASRGAYLNQLLAERLSRELGSGLITSAMQWGIDHEADARLAYQLRSDVDVTDCGFVDHPTIAMSGASPDGIVGDDGLVEFKCPNTSTHVATLIEQQVPDRYALQILWQLSCTGRAWCDFVSYDPRVSGDAAMYVQRVHRDDDKITELEQFVREFLEELDALTAMLDQRYGPTSIGVDEWRQLRAPGFLDRSGGAKPWC